MVEILCTDGVVIGVVLGGLDLEWGIFSPGGENGLEKEKYEHNNSKLFN